MKISGCSIKDDILYLKETGCFSSSAGLAVLPREDVPGFYIRSTRGYIDPIELPQWLKTLSTTWVVDTETREQYVRSVISNLIKAALYVWHIEVCTDLYSEFLLSDSINKYSKILYKTIK